jgi:hypothetical protein
LEDVTRYLQSADFKGRRSSVKGFAKAYAPKPKRKAKDGKENPEKVVDGSKLDDVD